MNFSGMNWKPNTPEDCYCVRKPPVTAHNNEKDNSSTCKMILLYQAEHCKIIGSLASLKIILDKKYGICRWTMKIYR